MSLGLVGLWGEWHTWPYDRDLADGYPNLMPTDNTIRTIIGAYDSAFSNIQLEVRYPLAGTENANIGYDPVGDFTHIAMIGSMWPRLPIACAYSFTL